MAFSTAQPGASIFWLPPVSRSSPARMRSSVDFPQPEGPTMQTNSPGAMRKVDAVERQHAAGGADVFLAQSGDLDRRAAPLDRHYLFPAQRVAVQRQPGSLLSLFATTNGPSFSTA